MDRPATAVNSISISLTATAANIEIANRRAVSRHAADSKASLTANSGTISDTLETGDRDSTGKFIAQIAKSFREDPTAAIDERIEPGGMLDIEG